MGRCIAEYWRGYHKTRCCNKAKVGEYCGVHDPIRLKERQEIKDKKETVRLENLYRIRKINKEKAEMREKTYSRVQRWLGNEFTLQDLNEAIEKTIR